MGVVSFSVVTDEKSTFGVAMATNLHSIAMDWEPLNNTIKLQEICQIGQLNVTEEGQYSK